MKRLLLTFVTLLIAVMSYSQTFPVEFMGIPVDGSKRQMISAIEQKGFIYDSDNDYLTGQFDGINAIIVVHANRDKKVDRVIVFNQNPFAGDELKDQYNKLIREFDDNKKYVKQDYSPDYTIPETEDITHEIIVNKKKYAVAYYQNLDLSNPSSIAKIRKYLDQNLDTTIYEGLSEVEKTNKEKEGVLNLIKDIMLKRRVWLSIEKESSGYFIPIFYDNEYNRPHGEDL